MKADERKAIWVQHRQSTWSGFTGLPNRMLDSAAFKSLKTAASVRTLVWFYQEARYEQQGKRKRSKGANIGRTDMIANNGKISFTFLVAEWLGMGTRQFARTRRELFEKGFIDITQQGRGVKGEYTKFAISTRWQVYKTDAWEDTPYPENEKVGWRSEAFKEKRREQKEKDNGHRRPLLTVTGDRYKPEDLSDNGRRRPLKPDLSSNSKRSQATVSEDLAISIGTSNGSGTRGSRSEPKVQGDSAPIPHNTIPTWPDQNKVLDLCDELLNDSIQRFGGNHPHREEAARARNLTDAISRAAGSRATN